MVAGAGSEWRVEMPDDTGSPGFVARTDDYLDAVQTRPDRLDRPPAGGRRGRPAGRGPARAVRRRDRLAQLRAADPEGLRGRVVLVDFWTYTCVNWLRTLPYVRAWDAKYRDAGADRDRRPHAGVRVRAHRRQRDRAVARASASSTRSRSTATTGSGGRSPITSGRRSTSPTRRAGSGTTTSARASTP